jgi:hypothetical protein
MRYTCIRPEHFRPHPSIKFVTIMPSLNSVSPIFFSQISIMFNLRLEVHHLPIDATRRSAVRIKVYHVTRLNTNLFIVHLSVFLPVKSLAACCLGSDNRNSLLDETDVVLPRLITAPDGSTSGAVAFLQSWKDAPAEKHAAPTMGICILHLKIF